MLVETFRVAAGYRSMRFLIALLLWALLFAVCWPIALLLLVAWPFLWLLSIPFRIVGVVLESLVALVKAVLFLPARLLGGGR
jgi:hypothetical protein